MSEAQQVRRELADLLHDRVVQVLAHLRLELEFVERHGGDDVEALRAELRRLSTTAAGALEEVRDAMEELREASR